MTAGLKRKLFVAVHDEQARQSPRSVSVTLEAANPAIGQIHPGKVDATTEDDLRRQVAEDEAAAMQDVAAYVRRIRKRMGMTQRDFAVRINVSVDTLRHWEKGKRLPEGPAKALLRILDKVPEIALAALD